MIRIFTLLAVIIGACFFGTTAPQQEVSNEVQADLGALRKQRVQLLQDRVAAIKKWVDEGRAGAIELVRPEMDVINAQLDYAETNAERKELSERLLSKYDILIELAESRVAAPAPPDGQNSNEPMLAESELFYLKSERIRFQIMHDSLD